MKNEKDRQFKSKIKFKVNSNNRMLYIESDKVLFLEGHNNYTFLHTQKEKFVCARTLKDYEASLSATDFIRIHKSHIINKGFVRGVEIGFNCGRVVLKNGRALDISRRRLKGVKEAFLKEAFQKN